MIYQVEFCKGGQWRVAPQTHWNDNYKENCNQVFITNRNAYCYIFIKGGSSDGKDCITALGYGMALLEEPSIQLTQYWRYELGKVRL